jgi:hypothetical protein
MVHTEIQASIQKTAVFTGSGVDISGITADWTIKLQVSQLTAGSIARFVFEESVDGFTTTFGGPTWEFKGDIESTFDKVKSIKKQDFPGLVFGTSGGKIRLHLTELTASSSVTFHGWSES